jgi:C4-dicarboxylate-specific signal transduction histidine kinase
VDVNKLVGETVADACEAFSGHKCCISLEPAPDLVELVGDGERLRQAVTNVITNAFEAMPAGGSLSVRTESTDEEVRIQISDTGRGISAEDLPAVTDPFFSRKESSKGRGLGLAITPRLVSAAQRYYGSWRRAVEEAGIDYSSLARAARNQALARRTKWSQKCIVERIRELIRRREPLQTTCGDDSVV